MCRSRKYLYPPHGGKRKFGGGGGGRKKAIPDGVEGWLFEGFFLGASSMIGKLLLFGSGSPLIIS